MKKLLLLLALASPSWGSFSGYSYQKTITISSMNVSNVFGTLTNFPVLVSANDVSLSTTTSLGGRLNSSGMDLVFSTMSDCSFKLNWDTETVQNNGTGVVISTFNAWVNVPLLTTATLTAATLYMCYGNSGVTTYQGVSTGTWDLNFKGVWHLSDAGAVTSRDSTPNINNATNNDMTVTPAKIGGGGNFNGSSAYSSVTDNASLGFTSAMTISAWANSTKADSNFYEIIDRLHVSTGKFDFCLRLANNNKWQAIFSDGTTESFQYGSTPSINTWYYVVATYDGTVTKVYVNGVDATNGGSNATTTIGHQAADTWIGRLTGGAQNQYWPGMLDEVRISASARNLDRIKTEYNNQSAPATFVTIGPEVGPNGSMLIFQ